MTTTNTTAFSVSTDDIISASLRQLGRLGSGAAVANHRYYIEFAEY